MSRLLTAMAWTDQHQRFVLSLVAAGLIVAGILDKNLP